jgi:hypothetical protein
MGSLRRVFGWPFRRLIDPRVAQIVSAVDDQLGGLEGTRPSVHERLDQIELLERHLGGHLGQMEERLAEGLRGLGDGLRGLGDGLSARLAAVTESAEAVVEGTRVVNESLAGFEPEYQIPPLDRRPLAELRWPAAEFINWAAGPGGYAAQAGLWTDIPVQVALEAGGATVRTVTERLVEEPFAFATLGGIEPGSRIIVVGGTESTVALALAALGHAVTVVDPRGYPFASPGLQTLTCRLDEVDALEAACDAVVALSTLGDAVVLGRAAQLSRPGGLLALTLPVGTPLPNDGLRVHDLEDIRALLSGWELEELRVVWRHDALTWVAGSPEQPASDRGVALVRARARKG